MELTGQIFGVLTRKTAGGSPNIMGQTKGVSYDTAEPGYRGTNRR
jgi:hypothetical protein